MVALNTALADIAVATSATQTQLNWMLGADCIGCDDTALRDCYRGALVTP
jgi:hypothetical protein